jgi:hypothetical protein
MSFLVGLDIGFLQDYTAVAVVERVEAPSARPALEMHYDAGTRHHFLAPVESPARYQVRHLQRFELGTATPEVVERTCALLQRPELAGGGTLVLDVTGVGRGVLHAFQQAGLAPLAVTIHQGHNTSHRGREWHVPKKDLVYTLTSLGGARPVLLALGDRVPFAAEVRQEMQTFSSKINTATAHESFAAWREQDHDDLVLALALACWWGEQQVQWEARVWGQR